MREDGWAPWSPGRTAGTAGARDGDRPSRGRGRAPENTLAGLRKAHELGARWVEFDVMLTRDGVPVLIHDETLQRTTDGRGRVARHTAAELGLLDAGAWFAPEFAGERVPTLAEAVAVLLELGLNANVEIKPAQRPRGRDRRGGRRRLQRLWPEHGPHLLLSSFEREAAGGGTARGTAARRAACSPSALPKDWAVALQDLACTTLHLDQGRATSATPCAC